MAKLAADPLSVVFCVAAILFLLFVVVWGISASMGRGGRVLRGWAVLPLLLAVAFALLVVNEYLPRWATGVLLAACVLAFEKLVARASRLSALLGHTGTVVKGHPGPLQVEIDGGLWDARADSGVVVLPGEHVTVEGRSGGLLVVRRA